MPIEDELPEKWAALCRAHGHATFAWSHNGSVKNGEITLMEHGEMTTGWKDVPTGTWRVTADTDVIEMSFGSSRHICRFKEPNEFVVEDKFLLRRNTNQSSYKDGQPRSRGWILQKNPGERRRAPQAASVGQSVKRRPIVESTTLVEVNAVPSFKHEDLKFETFAKNWTGPLSKMMRVE
eukprot:1738315-Amphidinium_carterae.1